MHMPTSVGIIFLVYLYIFTLFPTGFYNLYWPNCSKPGIKKKIFKSGSLKKKEKKKTHGWRHKDEDVSKFPIRNNVNRKTVEYHLQKY